MSQSKPSTPEPTVIAGRYQVVQKLGAGAFGTVFKAKDRVLKRMLAIKTIKVESLAAAGASLDEMLVRFKREAEVSAQLKHPNIVTIYDIGDDAGMYYLAMEFIDGVGLDKVISGSGRLPVERAANLGAQVADALDFAHRHNVVHRDIKPANIMIEAGDRVKVTDFGIAKLTDPGEQHLTMTGSLLGTPSYMSPEQARGNPLDGRSDLFSMGCVLYEMLAGHKAFRGDSITALIFKIITEEPPPIHELDPSIPDALVQIIAKALAKTPDGRYQTGRELADDLLAFTRPGTSPTVRQTETPTVPTSGPPPVPPTVRGTAATVAGQTAQSPPTARPAATAGVPPAPPTQIVEARPAPPPRPLSPPPPRPMAQAAPKKSGGGAGLLIGLGLAGLLFLGVAAGAGWYLFLRKPAPTQTAGNLTGGETATSTGPSAGETTQPSATQLGPSAPGGEVAPPPVTAPPATVPRATAPPATAPSRSSGTTGGTGGTAGRRGTSETKGIGGPPDTEPGPSGPTSTGASSFLDEEPPDTADGRAAGEQLAQKFRGNQGSQGGGTFGSTARFRQRERSPRNLPLVERPAVGTIRHVINAEEAFHKKNGRYGSLAEMATAQTLFLDVPHRGGSFQRAGYRFELSLDGDSFKVVAMPMNPSRRPFIGDDSGFIRTGLE